VLDSVGLFYDGGAHGFDRDEIRHPCAETNEASRFWAQPKPNSEPYVLSMAIVHRNSIPMNLPTNLTSMLAPNLGRYFFASSPIAT
jgi:hypothetical protein